MEQEIHAKEGLNSSPRCLPSENDYVELCIRENELNWFRTGSYGKLYMYHEIQEILK